jgi:hypothetical protein
MKTYHIALVHEELNIRSPSSDFEGYFSSRAAARKRFAGNTRNRDERAVWWTGEPPYVIEDSDGNTYPIDAKAERNKRQQARRASPRAKAREAAASRISYWRREYLAARIFTPREAAACDRLEQARADVRAARG